MTRFRCLPLCLIALSAPLLAGAALPPDRPLPHTRPADVVDASFLSRLLDGNATQRRSPSARRRAAPRQAVPATPAEADIPVPLPRPDERAQATTPLPTTPPPTDKPVPADKPAPQTQPDSQAAAEEKTPAAASNGKTEAGQDTPQKAAAEQQNPPPASDIPLPLPKPAEPAVATSPADGSKPTEDHAAPTSSPASTDDKAGPAGPAPEKPEDKAEASPPPPLVKEDPDELKACLADLSAIGTKFEPTDPIDDGKGCGIEHPLDIDEILPGVKLGGATMRCKTAQALGHWLKDTVQPAMNIALPGRRIVGVVPGSTYACRLRNSASTGKISEHARGNAYDVAAFKLDNGEKMEMKPRTDDHTMVGAFQRTASAGACLHFTTVLSPGSDAAHETHMHLDVMERKGEYRICE